jgi:putative membrane protein
MNILNRIAVVLLAGAVPAVYGQTPPAEPATSDPSSASSAHQQETMGRNTGGKMKMAADKDGADPATFVKKAAQGGMTEVEVAKLASSKTQNPEIRSFAQKMVKDHSAANEELATLAKSKGWQVPASLDAEHTAVAQKLSAKSGADFDAAYSKQMKADHEKTIALFEGATKSSDSDLVAFAKKTLPTLKEHRHLADALPAASHSPSADTPQRQ